jgi:coproporphyrinogen III oxidase-like Fe-S oxidoreductase
VAEEALALQQRGVRSVYLADAGFNRPLEHGKAVLEAFITAGVRLSISGIFEPGEVDKEFAQLYRRAGGQSIMLFAMSLSEPVLERMRKPFQLPDVFRGAEMLREAGVENYLFLTLGGPGETLETVEDSFRRAEQLRPMYTLIDHGFRVQPQTALRDIAVSEGAIAPSDDCFRATFYHSPATPPEMLAARIKRYEAAHRWDTLRMLPTGARVIWDKFRPY